MGRYIQPIIVILLALAPWCPTAEVPSLADGIDPIRLLTGDPQQLAAALGGGIELQAAIAAAAADAPVLETQLAERLVPSGIFRTVTRAPHPESRRTAYLMARPPICRRRIGLVESACFGLALQTFLGRQLDGNNL